MPFAQSTLQHFRAQLILHDWIQAVFLHSLVLAKKRGLLRSRHLCLVLDTGNLLVDSIRHLLRTLARVQQVGAATWAEAPGLPPLPGTQPQGERRGGLE